VNDNDDDIDLWWCPDGWMAHSIDHYVKKKKKRNNSWLSISMKMLSMYEDNYIRQD